MSQGELLAAGPEPLAPSRWPRAAGPEPLAPSRWPRAAGREPLAAAGRGATGRDRHRGPGAWPIGGRNPRSGPRSAVPSTTGAPVAAIPMPFPSAP